MALESGFLGTDRFSITRRLGAGGMGVVYEAIDNELGTRVALKTLQHLDGRALLLFKQEFRAVHDLEHRNLVRLGELLEHDGQWFFTMELIDGEDFLSHVREQADSLLADMKTWPATGRPDEEPAPVRVLAGRVQ